jgi:hypothetical protein
MRACSLVVLLCLAAVVPATAQSRTPSFLAYVHVIQVNTSGGNGIDACAIVGVDGQYRYEMSPPIGAPRSHTKVYRGKLPTEAFARFKSLVHAKELHAIASSTQPRGTLLAAQSYETVSLRILRPGETQEIVFTTVDSRNQMPTALEAFIPWMKEIQKSLGKPDRRAERRGCSALDATPDFTPELQKR